MSLLMWIANPSGIVVACDTLATEPDKSPRMFQSKVVPIPHLQMAIATTGVSNLMAEWLPTLMFDMVGSVDILDVVEESQIVLQHLWKRLMRRWPDGSASPTTTIYYFGFSARLKFMCWFVFRSEDNFEPERFADQSATAVKPWPADRSLLETLTDETSIIALAEQIKREQDARPLSDRIVIGGSLIITQIAPTWMDVREVHQFSDRAGLVAQFKQ